jgi:hypothetical protein
MRALSGCTRCGHVERSYGGGKPHRDCPECGFPLKDVDLLAARLLVREGRTARRARVQRQESLVELARSTSRRLRRAEDAPRAV